MMDSYPSGSPKMIIPSDGDVSKFSDIHLMHNMMNDAEKEEWATLKTKAETGSDQFRTELVRDFNWLDALHEKTDAVRATVEEPDIDLDIAVAGERRMTNIDDAANHTKDRQQRAVAGSAPTAPTAPAPPHRESSKNEFTVGEVVVVEALGPSEPERFWLGRVTRVEDELLFVNWYDKIDNKYVLNTRDVGDISKSSVQKRGNESTFLTPSNRLAINMADLVFRDIESAPREFDESVDSSSVDSGSVALPSELRDEEAPAESGGISAVLAALRSKKPRLNDMKKPLEHGDRVEVRFVTNVETGVKEWYKGLIVRRGNEPNRYYIRFDDGENCYKYLYQPSNTTRDEGDDSEEDKEEWRYCD
jgi:hypothetical protein